MVTIQDHLDRLAQSDRLTVAQALDLANRIADQVKQAATPLEESGEFERAAYLYDQAARAFEMAADKVPAADRERVTASGERWSVKADVTRYRVFTAPPISLEEGSAEEIASPPLPGVQPARAAPVTSTGPVAPSRPPTGPLGKPVETQDEPWTVTTSASLRGDSTPLPTAIKRPGGARDGEWSIAQTSPLADESETPGAILRKLHKARKKPTGKEHESSYER
jgi:hypothetical protein